MATRAHPITLIWNDTVDEELVSYIGDLALKVRHLDTLDDLLLLGEVEGEGDWLAQVIEGPFFDDDDLYSEMVWERRHPTQALAQRWCADLAGHEELRYVVGMTF